jgi:prophage regulatory protein
MTSSKKQIKVTPLPAATAPLPAATAAAQIETADADTTSPPRLITKAEVLRRVPYTYPTLWKMMKENKFPRSCDAGGKACWHESEVNSWIRNRPRTVLKGDADYVE